MANVEGNSLPKGQDWDTVSPVIEGDFVYVGGEPHILNYDTNILTLEDNIEPGIDLVGEEMAPNVPPEFSPNHQTTDSDQASDVEEDDVELSPDGILDEETIGRKLTNLGRSAKGNQQVYLHVSVTGFSLKNIDVIAGYVHLQKVELPYNDISDLSPLSNLEYLLILDVSHNRLNKLLDFKPPRNLKTVNMSFNQIEEMSDLSAHHYLMKLNLDNNNIHQISGLEGCHRLNHLSLAHNKIKKMEGLDDLPIQHLNLCHNQIMMIENLETLYKLKELNLSGNNIRSLKGLEDHSLLETIDLEGNEVIDITEIRYTRELAMLRNLNLLRNPIQELPDYRLSILFRLQSLVELDRHKVEVEEKVAAVNMFNPPLEVIAARDHIMHVVYNFLQPSRVWDSTLPSVETPYPMLVLAGPQGSGKKDLAMKLVEEFSDYFGYGVSHTTRKPMPSESSGKDYHFVSLDKFEMDIKMGQFIQTYECQDNWFGLQMESVESVAREGLACVVHMELEGVLTLKNTYFEPRYILVLPLDKDIHERRLRERGIYTEAQIEHTLAKSDLYVTYNQDHPGFYDMMISSDDIQEAYKRLRRLVMDYLGIGVSSPSGSEMVEGGLDSREPGEMTGPSLGTRTWSKPSIPESSMSQVYQRARTAPSPIMSGRGIVEEESLKRRMSAAKEAVAGYVPPLYEQILTQYPRTAPQSVEGQMGLGDHGGNTHRSFSAPVVNKITTAGSSSSSSSERSESSLSGLSSASDMRQGASPDGSVNDRKGLNFLPTDTVNPLELLSDQNHGQSPHKSFENPRPPSGRPGSQGSQRLGSDRHKVLPPISPVP